MLRVIEYFAKSPKIIRNDTHEKGVSPCYYFIVTMVSLAPFLGSSSSSSSLFVHIKQYMMQNNEQMIKPEQDSKVERPHLLLPLNRKRKNTKFA